MIRNYSPSLTPGFAPGRGGYHSPMTTTIHPHGRTELPPSRVDATARYLLGRGLRPYEVIEALVSELSVSIGEAFAATDAAMTRRSETATAPRV